MKKFFAIVLCLTFIFALAGCNSNSVVDTEKTLGTVEETNENKFNVQYCLTVGAENVYSIEYSVIDMEPMGIMQSDAPFEKGKEIILEGLNGCSDLRGLNITAFDEAKNIIWAMEVPNLADNEGITHLQEDDWGITDLSKQ